LTLRYSFFSYLKTIDNALFQSNLLNGALSGAVAQLACTPLFHANMRNQATSPSMPTVSHLKLMGLRGAVLGVCNLSIYQSLLNFLEQPLDPFGTRQENVDLKTRIFVHSDTP